MKIKHRGTGEVKNIYCKMNWTGAPHDYIYLTRKPEGGAGGIYQDRIVWIDPNLDTGLINIENNYLWVGSRDWEEVQNLSSNQEASFLLEQNW